MVNFKNPAEMARNLAAFGTKTEQRARKQLKEPAQVLLEEVRSQLNRPGSGRVYGRGRLGSKLHQASAPGEPPAPDTGKLRDSAHVEQDGETLRVMVDGENAAGLEFGSRAGKLAPRPFMRAALAAARARMTARFTATLRKK